MCRSLLRRGSASSTVRAHAVAVRTIADTVHPHAARNLYSIAAEAHGIPIRQISRDLGHATLAPTEAYLGQGHHLAGRAARILADLITAGEPPVPSTQESSGERPSGHETTEQPARGRHEDRGGPPVRGAGQRCGLIPACR
ncbi:hypothetical protein QRX50_22585 [Amycolatopsis carbonis]|uniref:Tyr recombinase domain-containing protein n=1 Tax=Amycolatopsis carbonis TaxID=715471 RepID=A0A9Y2IN07_9PSEU|nr:hypothetical protein [Amycolatopsis sp. 2-15]WIX83345.1 hypothetical protein QRX50_22585 [Amycolatopsis sp. 2-15]